MAGPGGAEGGPAAAVPAAVEPGPVASGDGGTIRGMVAVRAIAAGEVVLRVPLARCVTEAAARAALPELFAGAADDDDDVDPPAGVAREDVLACFLLAERAKGAASAWAECIAALPARYDGLVAWSAAEAAALPPDWRGFHADLRQRHLAALARLRAQLPAASALRAHLTEAGWTWAAAALHSRSMDLPDTRPGGAGRLVVLAPGADLFNHALDVAAGRSHRLAADGAAVEVVATRAYAAGEEVCISYGKKPSSRLLIGYGFVLPENPHDRVEVAIRIPMNSGPGDAASGLLLRAATAFSAAAPGGGGEALSEFDLPMTLDVPDMEALFANPKAQLHFVARFNLRAAAPLPAQLVAMMRIRTAEPEALAAAAGSEAAFDALCAGEGRGEAEERRALEALAALLAERAEGLDDSTTTTTATGDPAEVPYRERLARQLRAAELAILGQAREAVRSRLRETTAA